MNTLKRFWDSIRSKPAFVAFEGGASGALVDYAYDRLASGHLDFSRAGVQKALAFALVSGITAVRLLYRPQPTPTIVATIPPSQEIMDVAAKLTPVDPAAVAAQPTLKP